MSFSFRFFIVGFEFLNLCSKLKRRYASEILKCFLSSLSDKMHFDKYRLTALKDQKLKESYLFRDPEIFDSFSCCHHLGCLGIWPCLDF